MPDELMRGLFGAELPPAGQYGVAVCFLPQEEERRAELERLLTETVEAEGQRVVAWRDIPVEKDYVGITANYFAPYIKQLVVAAAPELAGDQDAFERKLYVIRRVAELAAGPDLVIPSFSSRTIVYKGMLTASQLLGYYPDLQDERTKTALALVHSRFSTNTFPSWELAHPYRLIAHNGEINTLRGNVNWMRARESQLASELFGDDLQKVLPLVRAGGSDSATFDNVLELLVLAGRSLPHALMMMVPEAWEGRDDLPEHLRAFYAFHSCMMEPWDGPAAIAFTDGRVIGATLDRNGLRPGRWLETRDGWVVLGSESGVMDEPAENVLRKGRLQPGKLFLVDLAEGRIVDRRGGQARGRHAPARTASGSARATCASRTCPSAARTSPREPLHTRQLAFGYTQEDLRVLLSPMAAKGEEPIGSMGNDLALAVLSDKAPPLFSYFKQLFAQVTNPPIDPIRESVVMSIRTGVGSEPNLLTEGPEHAHQLTIPHPILRNGELESLRGVDSSIFRSHTVPITWRVDDGPEGMERAVLRVAEQAAEAIAYGANVLVLSDRGVGPTRAAIPSLLAVAAVHHHLVREGTRLQAGLVLESGEPREVHHFATLIGYGASAVNPYLMLESLQDIAAPGELEQVERNVVKAIGKGLLKTLSKMGISTIQSYNGAQIFEAVGLAPEVIERHFTGTASRIGGIGLDVLARETLDRHVRAYPEAAGLLPVGGVYAWRRDGEHHQWNPKAIAELQHAVRHGGRPTYDEWAEEMNNESAARASLRGLLELKFRPDGGIPLEEVEPASEIVKRFATGAMSLGSLSREAHETLAIAMNRIGGRSNTGEGGEDAGALHARPQRRLAPLGDQADRLGPLRRDRPLPHQRRRDPDQDGPGRQARRGRPAARPQGRRLHRQDPLLDAGRRPDLAAAAPRHLLDRGPQAADLRPALRQPERARVGQARGRGRRRHGRRRRGQGQRRPHPHLRPRRRHRRVAAVLDPVGGHPVGDRPGRDAADARAQRPALARLGADRRADEDGPRRRRGGAARRRRGRLLDRAADRRGLHHDARLPPQHLPGRDRDPGSGAAQALRGDARARRQLPVLRGRGGARADGAARRAALRRPDRPHGAARGRAGRSTTGRRRGSTSRCCWPSRRRRPTRRAGACGRSSRRCRARSTGT